MALYAFDGTGNEDKPDDEDGGFDSNVLHFFNGYADPAKNDDPAKKTGSLYLKGIGKRAHTDVGDKFAEALGIGGHHRVRQMIERLDNNLKAGDTNVDVVGFSRGAALGVSFANEVADKFPHVIIRFLGVWDIVGEFGLPGEHVNAGHNLHMPPNVKHCFHGMALDERRALFQLTRLSGTRKDVLQAPQEVWFRGVHSDVGGGNGNFGLNWIGLNWLYAQAKRLELPISASAIAANLLHQALKQDIKEHKVAVGPARNIRPTDLLHASVQLDPADTERQRNDPRVPLARIDDAGTITAVAGVG